MLSNNLKLAVEAALEAGRTILEIYKSDDFEINIKSDKSPLTIADIKSHNIISECLQKTGIPILSEEGRNIPYNIRKNWNLFWMVDPIDGTKEFINRNGEFTVNIALIENHKPVMGVVYAPVLKNLYFSEKNLGSYKAENIESYIDLKNSNLIDLSISSYPDVYTLVVSKSHMNQETQKFLDDKKIEHGQISLASFGSSLKICKVADGIANCYPRLGPTMEWDTAAAHAVAEFAGCKVLLLDNKTILNYNKSNLLNPFFTVIGSQE